LVGVNRFFREVLYLRLSKLLKIMEVPVLKKTSKVKMRVKLN
jgi:hypothetical protein